MPKNCMEKDVTAICASVGPACEILVIVQGSGVWGLGVGAVHSFNCKVPRQRTVEDRWTSPSYLPNVNIRGNASNSLRPSDMRANVVNTKPTIIVMATDHSDFTVKYAENWTGRGLVVVLCDTRYS